VLDNIDAQMPVFTERDRGTDKAEPYHAQKSEFLSPCRRIIKNEPREHDITDERNKEKQEKIAEEIDDTKNLIQNLFNHFITSGKIREASPGFYSVTGKELLH
jgi:hypothetical protein